jgi:hypothetical protein
MSKIKGLLDARYGLRTPRLHATVTAVPLVDGRSAGYVIATVGGVGGVRVNVSPDQRAPFMVGDTLVVDGLGTPAATEYWAGGRVAGARADSDMYQFPGGATVTVGGVSTTFGAGDILLGSTLTDMSNWWYQYESGRWQIRKGALMHGAIGDLNGLYGYSASESGSAFGQYSAGQINITTDPTNGFRIRNHTTPVFQADTSGVVWALSTFRAGTGDDSITITATDADYRLFAGSETSSAAPLRILNTGRIGFFADGPFATQGSVFWENPSTGAEGDILLTDGGGTVEEPISALIFQAKSLLTNTRLWLVADGHDHDYYAFLGALGPESADFRGLRVGGTGKPSAMVEVVGNVYASAGYLTKDEVAADFTIPTGYSMIYPNMSVPPGVTVTAEGTLIDFVLP